MPIITKNGIVSIINALKNGSLDGFDIGKVIPGFMKATDIEATNIGLNNQGTGSFTTLAASGSVSGAGITALMAAPGTIGSTTPGPIDGTYISSNKYYYCDDFDDEAAAVTLALGLRGDYWTRAGTNDDTANVVYTAGPGGTVEVKNAAADNDSVTLLGVLNFNTTNNPVAEFRVKIDDKATAGFLVGLSGGANDAIDTYPNNCFLVGINSDNAHTYGATRIVAFSNDDNAGVVYDDCGVAIVNDTYVIIKIDLTDTEQPRVWINGTEVAAASITGTVKAATAMGLYMVVQNLAGGAIQRRITVDYVKAWADRG